MVAGAKMQQAPLLSRATGLNTRIVPKRIPVGENAPLATAVNVDIDDSLTITRRLGTTLESSVKSHSLFRDKGPCLIAQDRDDDTAIYHVSKSDDTITLTGIQSGLPKGLRISYTEVGPMIFWTNGAVHGCITNLTSGPWPQPKRIGATTKREFAGAPVGTKIAYFQNRIWVAVGTDVFVSEPDRFGTFDLEAKRFSFPKTVIMLRPTPGGIWISDEQETGFIPAMQQGERFSAYRYVRRSYTTAHEWSAAHRLVDLSTSHRAIPGLSAMWSCDEGLCIGTETGQLIIETEDKLIYPTGGTGATVSHYGNVINIVN